MAKDGLDEYIHGLIAKDGLDKYINGLIAKDGLDENISMVWLLRMDWMKIYPWFGC